MLYLFSIATLEITTNSGLNRTHFYFSFFGSEVWAQPNLVPCSRTNRLLPRCPLDTSEAYCLFQDKMLLAEFSSFSCRTEAVIPQRLFIIRFYVALLHSWFTSYQLAYLKSTEESTAPATKTVSSVKQHHHGGDISSASPCYAD